MSFGRRRFDRLVLLVGEPHARFLPLDLGRTAETFSEDQLRVAIETNRLCPAPLNDEEEQLALRAFVAFTKNPKGSPLRTAMAQQARTARQQEPTLVIVDALSPKERATIERWRKRLLKVTEPKVDSIERREDLDHAVLQILDLHLPKGSA